MKQSGRSYQAAAPLALISGSFPSAIAILPDGSKVYVLATIGLNQAFCVVDTAAWTMQQVWLPDADFSSQLRGIAVMPDGNRLLGADSVFTGIRVFDAASLRIVQTITWSSGVEMPYGVAVAPDGSRIFCAAAGSADLVIAEQVQPS